MISSNASDWGDRGELPEHALKRILSYYRDLGVDDAQLGECADLVRRMTAGALRNDASPTLEQCRAAIALRHIVKSAEVNQITREERAPARGRARAGAYLRGVAAVTGVLFLVVEISVLREAIGAGVAIVDLPVGYIGVGAIGLMFGLIVGHAWAEDPSSAEDPWSDGEFM